MNHIISGAKRDKRVTLVGATAWEMDEATGGGVGRVKFAPAAQTFDAEVKTYIFPADSLVDAEVIGESLRTYLLYVLALAFEENAASLKGVDLDADGTGIAHVHVDPPADGLEGFSVTVPLQGPHTEGEVRIYLRDELAPAVRNAAKKHGKKYLGALRELPTTGSQPAFLHKIREALL